MKISGEKLEAVARSYPVELVDHFLTDIDRVKFQLSLVPSNQRICDIGGGTSMFSAACMMAGAKSIVVVDDFKDPINGKYGDTVFAHHRNVGVKFLARDIVTEGIGDFVDAFDVITCICSIEHWHHSPKRVLHQMMKALTPGGKLIIGLPNALNIRKRVSWVLGTGEWTTMDSWYEQPVFRSHVREASVSDMRYIARDIGLSDWRIYGRNWAGFLSGKSFRRVMTRAMDRALRLRPSLCSDLYLVGHREL